MNNMMLNDLYNKIIDLDLSEYTHQKLYDLCFKLDDEIERLNNIIDKAIEYINDIAPWEEKTEDGGIIKGKLIQDDYVDILLDILKGVDKE